MQAEMNQIGALFQKGELDAARKMCRALVQKHPTNDKVRYAHAMICQQAGDVDAAIAAYQMTVKISPSHLQALSNLGGLLTSAGRHDEAVEPLMRALKLQPNSAPARYNLARVYHAQGKLAAALEEALKARAIDDNVPDIHSMIGLLSADMDKFAEAASAYGRLTVMVPEQTDPWMYQAANLQISGNFEEAEAVLYRGLKHHPGAPRLHTQLALGRRSKEQEAESISALKSALDRGNLEPEDHVKVLFSLADLLDRAGDYKSAIGYYHEGNLRKKSEEPYDAKAFAKVVDETIATFTPSFFAQRKGFGHSADKPVFVVGMPRSGTTLLERLLSSHPDVANFGELGDFSIRCRQEEFGDEPARLFPDEVAACSAADIAGFAGRFLSFVSADGNHAARAVDSTPGNTLQLGLIALTFPNAHVIHSRRNLLDNAVSMYFQSFLKGSVLYANDMSDIVSAFHCKARLMEHFEQMPGLGITSVKYEDVVSDTEGQVSRLLGAIGLEAGAASFDNTASADPIRSASIWQARQPVYKTSVEKWRNYESYVGPLIDGLAGLE